MPSKYAIFSTVLSKIVADWGTRKRKRPLSPALFSPAVSLLLSAPSHLPNREPIHRVSPLPPPPHNIALSVKWFLILMLLGTSTWGIPGKKSQGTPDSLLNSLSKLPGFLFSFERKKVNMEEILPWIKSYSGFFSVFNDWCSWRGVLNKAIKDWCNGKFSPLFINKYKAILEENLAGNQRSLTVKLTKQWTPEMFMECCVVRNLPLRREKTKLRTGTVISLWFCSLLLCP